jgi:hypothetical protein
MTIQKKIVYVSVLILTLGFSLLTNEVSATEMNKNEKILENVSKEGREAMRDIRWARVAMFDGDTKKAKDLLEKSKHNLAEVEKQTPESVVTVKTKEKIGGKTVSNEKKTMTNDLVPIDAGLTLSEDFVSTAEKKEKINKANEHLKKQETSKAVQVLREADIGISVTRFLMPVNATIKHVNDAMDLLDKHQYYEANLALKAAEDGMIVDSVLLYEPLENSANKN